MEKSFHHRLKSITWKKITFILFFLLLILTVFSIKHFVELNSVKTELGTLKEIREREKKQAAEVYTPEQIERSNEERDIKFFTDDVLPHIIGFKEEVSNKYIRDVIPISYNDKVWIVHTADGEDGRKYFTNNEYLISDTIWKKIVFNDYSRCLTNNFKIQLTGSDPEFRYIRFNSDPYKALYSYGFDPEWKSLKPVIILSGRCDGYGSPDSFVAVYDVLTGNQIKLVDPNRDSFSSEGFVEGKFHGVFGKNPKLIIDFSGDGGSLGVFELKTGKFIKLINFHDY